jgi:hypothetical protein
VWFHNDQTCILRVRLLFIIIVNAQMKFVLLGKGANDSHAVPQIDFQLLSPYSNESDSKLDRAFDKAISLFFTVVVDWRAQ